MPKYKTLIFDLDDTLINNDESIRYAFSVILKYLGIPYSEELFLKWKSFDTTYWHTWETGNMILPYNISSSKEKVTYLRANRFVKFFEYLDISFIAAIRINQIYCDMLGVNIFAITGAKTLLSDVVDNHELIIATNGPKTAAFDKLSKSELLDYISYTISAEEVGFSKPSKEFFDQMYEKIKNKDKKSILVIGDSLTTDVLLGMNNGIDTCWYNPQNLPIPESYKPTMTIKNLLELKKKI